VPFRKPAEVANLLAAAKLAIASRKEVTVFIDLKRAQGKSARMEPTDNQSELMRFIMQHAPVPFAETIGMNWTMLGGLLTRGLVTWVTIHNQNRPDEIMLVLGDGTKK
jgi:hypothetical protein